MSFESDKRMENLALDTIDQALGLMAGAGESPLAFDDFVADPEGRENISYMVLADKAVVQIRVRYFGLATREAVKVGDEREVQS